MSNSGISTVEVNKSGWTAVACMPLLAAALAAIQMPWHGSAWRIALGLLFLAYGLYEARKAFAYRQGPVPPDRYPLVLRWWVDGMLLATIPMLLSSQPHTLRSAWLVVALTLFGVVNNIVPREAECT